MEGANGAGKTSLLRLIAGFLAPAAGRLVVKTRTAKVDDGEERGKSIGWLGHQDGLKPQLTVRRATGLLRAALSRHRRSPRCWNRWAWRARRDLPCRYLCAGQRRRLALARLLVSARPLWLLDEPFAALDTAGQALVAQLMALHCGAGRHRHRRHP